MRLARQLAILTAMAMAAMALTATSASAVEVSLEPAGVHCTNTVLMSNHSVEGGCKVRFVSEEETTIQVQIAAGTWVTITTCEDQFEAAIGENGEGYLYNAITSGHAAGDPCTRTQCDEGEAGATPHAKMPWHLRLNSTTSMEVRFCLRSSTSVEGTAGTTCHINYAVSTSPTHRYELSAKPSVCENNTNIRFIGHWNQVVDAAHPAIEIAP